MSPIRVLFSDGFNTYSAGGDYVCIKSNGIKHEYDTHALENQIIYLDNALRSSYTIWSVIHRELIRMSWAYIKKA